MYYDLVAPTTNFNFKRTHHRLFGISKYRDNGAVIDFQNYGMFSSVFEGSSHLKKIMVIKV